MKTKLTRLLAVVMLCIQLQYSSMAWGPEGHTMIVQMALQLLSPQVRQKVLAQLGNYPLDRAANWMDAVRGRDPWTNMDNWHFVNMEKNQTYADVASHDDVVYNLDRVIRILENPHHAHADSNSYYIEMLFHLVGDITQPLHCGYGSDRGGTFDKVYVEGISNPAKNSLHKVWDGEIIRNENINLQTCIQYYLRMTPQKRTAVIQGTTLQWMLAGRSYLVPRVYHLQVNPHGVTNVPRQYLTDNAPIVQQQLVFAAIRLADVLNKSFHS
jgi:hypothetical protein